MMNPETTTTIEEIRTKRAPASREIVDWLEYTIPYRPDFMEWIMPDIDEVRTWRKCRSPQSLWEFAYECDVTGAKWLVSDDEMIDDKIIFSGKPLAKLRTFGIDGRMLIGRAIELEADFRRVDVAVDVFHTPLTPVRVLHAWQEQRVSTNLRTYKYIAGREGVETLYCGSMHSRKRKFRIYDKSAEQGLGKNWWTRFELEERSNADGYAYHVEAGLSIGKLINRKLKPLPGSGLSRAWDKWIASGTATISHIEDEYTDPDLQRWHWLERVAAPALGRAIKVTIDKHPEILDTQLVKFFELVKREID
jgi:hypothetical protein